jgi:hypothetical protein
VSTLATKEGSTGAKDCMQKNTLFSDAEGVFDSLPSQYRGIVCIINFNLGTFISPEFAGDLQSGL